jgi:hypothetical protein
VGRISPGIELLTEADGLYIVNGITLAGMFVFGFFGWVYDHYFCRETNPLIRCGIGVVIGFTVVVGGSVILVEFFGY